MTEGKFGSVTSDKLLGVSVFHNDHSGMLWLMLPIYAVSLWICNYKVTFGERDSYRVFVALVDAITHGRPFHGALMYGQNASPGYYAALQYLIPGLGIDIHQLTGMLNGITFLCSILCLVPLFVVAKTIGGRTMALSAIVLIYTVPVWWSVSEYAHPVWPALMFFLIALALAAARHNFPGLGTYVCDGAVALALAACFSMRVDAIVMAPMMSAFCIEHGKFSLAATLRLALCGVVAIAAVLILKRFYADAILDSQSESVWHLLITYFTPSHFVSESKRALSSFALAINPFLLISFVASVIYIICKGYLAVFLLTVPTVAFNFFFWIPQHNPRHYLYLVPALVLAVASVAGDLMDGALRPRKFRTTYVALALFCVGISSVLHPIFSGRTVFYEHAVLAALICVAAFQVLREKLPRAAGVFTAGMIAFATVVAVVAVMRPNGFAMQNQYPPGMGAQYTRLGKPLLALPPLGKPVVVVADAFPIVAAMQMNASEPLMVGFLKPRLLEVKNRNNSFRFFTQGWIQQDAVEAAISLSRDTEIVLLNDPAVAPDVADILSDQPNIKPLKWP